MIGDPVKVIIDNGPHVLRTQSRFDVQEARLVALDDDEPLACVTYDERLALPDQRDGWDRKEITYSRTIFVPKQVVFSGDSGLTAHAHCGEFNSTPDAYEEFIKDE
jgi:hypothetical protein